MSGKGPRANSSRTRAPAAGPLLAALFAASALALLYAGRGQVIAGDDLFYAQRLAQGSLGHTILHGNVYLLALPMVVYKALFATVGIEPYWVYRLLAAVLSLLCAALLYRLARPLAGLVVAAATAAVLVVLGPGGEVILSGARLPSLMAIASGLAAWLALARDARRSDVLASVLLTISVTSHPSGLGFLAGAAVLIGLRGTSRWRTVWVLAAPAAAVVAYQAFFQIHGSPRADVAALLAFMRDTFISTTAAVSGMAPLIHGSLFDNPPAQLLALALALFIAATAVVKRRELRTFFWAGLAALLVLMAATRLAPYGFLRVPDAARYLYPQSALLLLVLAGALGPWLASVPALRTRLVAAAAGVVLAAALAGNLVALRDSGDALRSASDEALGQYSAYDLDGRAMDSSYAPNPFQPTVANYLAAAGAWGGVGLSPDELASASNPVRAAADRALVGGLGVRLRPAPEGPDGAMGSRPAVRANEALHVRSGSGCVELSRAAKDGATPQALVTLPRGGASIRAPDAKGTPVYAYRFASSTDVALPWPGGSRDASLDLPIDSSTTPWRVLITVGEPLRICGHTPPNT